MRIKEKFILAVDSSILGRLGQGRFLDGSYYDD